MGAAVRAAHKARGERMLHARSEPGHQHREQKGAKPVRLGKQQPARGGPQRSEREQAAFAEPFGDEPERNLARRHRGVEGALQRTGLGQRQAEGLCPQRQEHEQGLGQAVVGGVGGRARREDRARRTATRGRHRDARGYREAAAHAIAKASPPFRVSPVSLAVALTFAPRAPTVTLPRRTERRWAPGTIAGFGNLPGPEQASPCPDSSK